MRKFKGEKGEKWLTLVKVEEGMKKRKRRKRMFVDDVQVTTVDNKNPGYVVVPS